MKRNVMKLFVVMLVIGMVAVAGAIAADDSITGTVEQTDNGIVISSDDGDQYIVMGKDLSSMVGQTVKATGTLAEGKSGKIITVISVEPADQ